MLTIKKSEIHYNAYQIQIFLNNFQVESVLKNCPLVDNVCIYGDSKK